MKSFFNRTFSSELEFWEYLKSFRDQHLECADGYYCGRAHGQAQDFSMYEMHYFPDYKSYDKGVDKLLSGETHFSFIIVDGTPTEIFFGSLCITAIQEKQDDVWIQKYYKDSFEDDSFCKKKFTKEELRAACEELVQLLIVHGKQVD